MPELGAGAFPLREEPRERGEPAKRVSFSPTHDLADQVRTNVLVDGADDQDQPFSHIRPREYARSQSERVPKAWGFLFLGCTRMRVRRIAVLIDRAFFKPGSSGLTRYRAAPARTPAKCIVQRAAAHAAFCPSNR